ncbi:MAG: DNA cytosine methyltransferase [Candidatus Heimdallarchaeota archaeon]|nr:DNA cytosine methyltransferase [Candidatus Heimdallarchaeota archaeon]
MSHYNILDLFCGAGGFAYGFSIADPKFQIVLAIDANNWAIETYKANFSKKRVIQRDIAQLHSIEVLDLLENKNPDIIIASPPCEAFSAANVNRRKTDYERLYSDVTGRIFLHAIRLIIDLEPKFFFIENVSRVASENMQDFIRKEFSTSSYTNIYFNLVESLDYLVPSARKRVFVSNFKLSKPILNNKLPSVSSAFDGLPHPESLHGIRNHSLLPPSRNIAKKIPRTPPGGALVYFQGGNNKTYRNYIRLEYDLHAPTVMGKSRFIHPLDNRLCTVREHARLMSYPDNFYFSGPTVWQYNMIGESVPPLLSKGIAQQLAEQIP